MRVMGHNVFAVLVAAIAIYAIEFVIFGLIIPGDQYASMVGLSVDDMHPDRMPVGIAPPLLAAIGLSLVVKWRNASSVMAGAVTGVLMAIFFAFAAALYGYVYGAHNEQFLAVNLAHFIVCYAVAGAIVAIWK